MNQSKQTDGLQGQGEELSLNNSDVSELQKLINSKDRKDEIFNTGFENEEANKDKSSTSGDDFLNFKPKVKTEISKNQTKSIPRSNIRPQTGRNIQNSEINMNQRSFIGAQNPSGIQRFHNNPHTPMNPNLTQNMALNHPFVNIPPPGFNIHAHKAWNSAHKNQLENINKGPNPYSAKIVNNFSRPINPSQSQNQVNLGNWKLKKTIELKKQKSDSYATEDWFAKVDNQPSNNATGGTIDNSHKSTVKKEDSFLLQLSGSNVESSKADEDLSEVFGNPLRRPSNPSSPKNLLSLSPKNRGTKPKVDLVKESNELKRELQLIEKEKQLNDLANKVKCDIAKLEEVKKILICNKKNLLKLNLLNKWGIEKKPRNLKKKNSC